MHKEQLGNCSQEQQTLRRGLSESQLEAWDRQGYFSIEGFIADEACRAMVERAWELARRPDEARAGGSIVRYEANFAYTLASEERVSKLFRLHRETLFRQFCERADVRALLSDLIGPDVDFFLSQIIFKLRGSHGQPWHQDAAVFPFEPDRPVVGLWLALTDAEGDSSCLEVIPGSQAQDLVAHGREQRADSGSRYVTATNADTSNAEPLPMRSGDLLVLDSHLIHRSTDNRSDRARIAASWHFATAGTIDHTAPQFARIPYYKWIAIVREGNPVAT